jgi:hypothetical protein
MVYSTVVSVPTYSGGISLAKYVERVTYCIRQFLHFWEHEDPFQAVIWCCWRRDYCRTLS